MRRAILVVVASALSFGEAYADCLSQAAEFAQKICGEVKQRGSGQLIGANGQLNAEAKGLVRRLVGSAGGEIAAETSFDSYENVVRDGWNRSEVLNGTSGWRGGGYNPDTYCSDYKNSIVANYNLGGKAYALDVLNKGEDARWTGSFNRTRQYNYHCQVRLSWEPIYKTGRGEVCGVQSD